MDGFPETLIEAKFLFDSFEQEQEQEDDEEEETTKPTFNQLIMPGNNFTFVIICNNISKF